MSVFSKIISVLLYVVFGASVVVMGFFYFGDQLVNETAFNAKKAKLETPEEQVFGSIQAKEVKRDTTVIESQGLESEDSVRAGTQVIQPPAAKASPASVDTKPVRFSFIEKLIYFKTDIALSWAYFMVGVTILAAIIFPLLFMFSNLRNMVRTLGILAGAAILIGIAYMLSSGTPISITGYQGTDNSNPSVLKLIDTGIFMTYFILGLALLVILYSEIVKLFK